MFTTTAILFAVVACAAAGAALIHFTPRIRAGNEQYLAETCQAIEARDQALAELERVRARNHSHQTVEMLEDLAAILLDIDGEAHEFIRYLFARLKNADQILAAGRPGPYSYQAADTHSRPARPGAAVKSLWTVR